jgi:L,D-peptidoglycan transpeptidase YkuD (ErfK/YbiS/YcfS/YnhG family)
VAIGENGFGVELRQADDGTPMVVIVDATGSVVAQRSCRDGTEARTYASTVRQHIYWLSAEKFREYYRI